MPTVESIQIPGIEHHNPIPAGARVGNVVFSSLISGKDPGTNRLPDSPQEEAALLFRNIREFMRQAGGVPENIGHVRVYVRNLSDRQYFNKEWLAMFPDENRRPARHVIEQPPRGKALFQVELTAVL